jgi:hypothetical protein
LLFSQSPLRDALVSAVKGSKPTERGRDTPND